MPHDLFTDLDAEQQARVKELTDAWQVALMDWVARHSKHFSEEGIHPMSGELFGVWRNHTSGLLAMLLRLRGWEAPGPELYAILLDLQACVKDVLAAGDEVWPYPYGRDRTDDPG